MTEESEEYEGRESLQGWVKMHRRYANEPVFQDENLWRLFSWLLLYARHTPGPVGMASGRGGKRLIRLEAGQLVTGRKKLASVLGWPESSVKNRLQKLQDLGVISVEVDSQFSIVTVTNFQGEQFIPPVEKDSQRTTKGQSKTNQRPTKGQPKDNQRTQRKNVQNVLNEKNDTREGESSDSVDAHSLDENPTSVSQVIPELGRLVECKPSDEVIARAKKLEMDIELLGPSLSFFESDKLTDPKIRQEKTGFAIRWADGLEKKHQCRCSPFNIDTEEKYNAVQAQKKSLEAELKAISNDYQKTKQEYKQSLGMIPAEQLPTIAQTFFNYWVGVDWKRRGKPVNWRGELSTWLWREIEKIQKAEKNRKPVVDPYANCPKY